MLTFTIDYTYTIYIISHKYTGDNSLKNKKHKDKMKIRIPFPSILFYAFLIIYDKSIFTLITLGAALLHELGHMTAAGLCGIGITEITVYPFGADMKLNHPLRSYRKDIIISAAGAAVNAAAALSALLMPASELREWIIACNLTLVITNLIPVEGLDGGGILRGIICIISNGEKADSTLKATSFAGLFLMWTAAVYILFVNNGNPSLFIISCALFVSVFVRDTHRKKTE